MAIYNIKQVGTADCLRVMITDNLSNLTKLVIKLMPLCHS